jgi:hypothetical protein
MKDLASANQKTRLAVHEESIGARDCRCSSFVEAREKQLDSNYWSGMSTNPLNVDVNSSCQPSVDCHLPAGPTPNVRLTVFESKIVGCTCQCTEE